MANKNKRKQLSNTTPPFELTTTSVDETQVFGERLGRLLSAGDVIALNGELGSGKTTLVKGIARGLGRDPDEVKSPTFVLMREYIGEPSLIHIDGYRLDGPHAASWLDVELMFSPHKITILEWAERFTEVLPEERLEIQLSHVRTNQRKLQLRSIGPRADEIIKHLLSDTADIDMNQANIQPEESNAAGD